MICINSKSTNPYINLAIEEYLLKNMEENCFMLWQNEPTIVVGKHQNTIAEININYIKEKDINIVRRLSGGGAVFHDSGNLNFTFIETQKGNNNINFEKYTKPIIEVLQSLGADANLGGRNDIIIEGKKVSGNSEHLYKDRILHHGTLLFNSKIEDLSKALKINPLKYQDKSVKSVRSRVANISDFLEKKINIQEFKKVIFDFILKNNEKSKMYELSKLDFEKINYLVENKYKSWEWNFGLSPKYNFLQTGKTSGGILEVQLLVDKGIIHEVKFSGDFFNLLEIENFEELLVGVRHNEIELKNLFKKIPINQYFLNVKEEEILDLMF